MEEGAKRRLVGTAVVVLLLVIFVPMLLDEKPPESLPDEDLAVPGRPNVESSVGTAPTSGPDAPLVVPAPRELAPPPLSEPSRVEHETPPAGPAREPVAPSEPEASAIVHDKPSAQPPPVVKQERPAPPPTAGGISSWVVQVASLSELPRAKGLERKLRGEGFPAFIEEARVGQKTFHRVRVGPEADRKRIEAMAASIKEKTGLSGQVLRYP
jgi:DedD protein